MKIFLLLILSNLYLYPILTPYCSDVTIIGDGETMIKELITNEDQYSESIVHTTIQRIETKDNEDKQTIQEVQNSFKEKIEKSLENAKKINEALFKLYKLNIQKEDKITEIIFNMQKQNMLKTNLFISTPIHNEQIEYQNPKLPSVINKKLENLSTDKLNKLSNKYLIDNPKVWQDTFSKILNQAMQTLFYIQQPSGIPKEVKEKLIYKVFSFFIELKNENTNDELRKQIGLRNILIEQTEKRVNKKIQAYLLSQNISNIKYATKDMNDIKIMSLILYNELEQMIKDKFYYVKRRFLSNFSEYKNTRGRDSNSLINIFDLDNSYSKIQYPDIRNNDVDITSIINSTIHKAIKKSIAFYKEKDYVQYNDLKHNLKWNRSNHNIYRDTYSFEHNYPLKETIEVQQTLLFLKNLIFPIKIQNVSRSISRNITPAIKTQKRQWNGACNKHYDRYENFRVNILDNLYPQLKEIYSTDLAYREKQLEIYQKINKEIKDKLIKQQQVLIHLINKLIFESKKKNLIQINNNKIKNIK